MSMMPPQQQEQQGHIFRRLCQQGSIQLMDQMLNAGMHIENAQEDGCTGLWLASEVGNVDAVRFLCGRKANVNTIKQSGNVSALYIACQNGHEGVVDVLLLNGANPNTTKSTGSTPVFIAAQQGFGPILKSLLKAGANYNTPNGQGITPLMIAAFQGNLDCVKQLLAAGADPYATGQGKNTLEWAQTNGHRGSVQQAVESHLRDVERQIQRRNEAVYAPGNTTPNASGNLQQGAAGAGGHHGSGVSTLHPNTDSYLPATSSLSVNSWYTPQFLSNSPRRLQARMVDPNESGYYDTRSHSVLSAGAGGPKRARSISTASGLNTFEAPGLSTSMGSGFSGGGLTPMALAEEARRQEHFHKILQKERAKEGASIPENMDSTNWSQQKTYAVEQEWNVHKMRLKNASEELAQSSAEVHEAWMYSLQATTTYAQHMSKVRTEMLKAEKHNQEQDKQSAANIEKKGFAFPTLPSEKLENLTSFMARGHGAKGPPPPLPEEEEEEKPKEVDPYAIPDAITLPTSHSTSGSAAPEAATSAEPAEASGGKGKKMSALQARLAAKKAAAGK